jgi:hypothetical protein
MRVAERHVNLTSHQKKKSQKRHSSLPKCVLYEAKPNPHEQFIGKDRSEEINHCSEMNIRIVVMASIHN